MKVFSITLNRAIVSSVTALLVLPYIAHAEEAESFTDAITGGKVYIDVRYRYEFVDQDGISNNANASTVRTKLGYKTGRFHGLSGVIEFENSTEVASGAFNNTVNGEAGYPVVADPENTEINQAYLTYAGIEGFAVSAGRQAVNLDNQRFVGTVAWRQNDQTFDAISIVNTSARDLTLLYAYVWNVNRIFGEDHPLGDLDTDTHIFNVSWSGFELGKVSLYGYFLDLNTLGTQALSSKTCGVRFAGAAEVGDGMKVHYIAEFANQTDNADNPGDFSVNYFLGETAVEFRGIKAMMGYEVLGSDNGTAAFQTPLATLHKFNGWADKFLGTPGTGLRDFYLGLDYLAGGTDSFLDGTKLTAVYHRFDADFGGVRYGTEWNFMAGRKILEHYSLNLKFARYKADSFAADTTKFWLSVGASF